MNKSSEIKTKAVSGAIWKFFERMSAQLVSMVVAIILARLLNPQDYSVVSIVSIFFTFANVFINSGFNIALIRKKDADAEEYSSALFLSVSVSLFFYIALYIFSPMIARLYQQQALVPVIRIMGIILPINAVKAIVCAYISSNLQFRKFFFATLIGTVISAIVGIVMAYAGFGHWALVTQQMTNAVFDTLILCRTTRIPLVLRISLKKTKDMFSYCWKVLLSSIIDVVYKELNPLFIGLRYTGADLAFYTKGKSFPGLLASACSNTLSAVLFPVLAKFQDNKDELIRCLRRFTKIATFVVFPALLGFCAVADNFVSFFLTDKWLSAAKYIRVFCIAELALSVEAGNREALKAIGKSDVFLKYEVIKKIVFFTIIGLAIAFTKSPVGLACSAIGCTIVVITASVLVNAKVIGYAVKQQLQDFLPNLINAGIMCLAVWMVNIKGVSVFAELIIQIVVGIVTYIIVSAVTKNDSFLYVWNTMKPRMRGFFVALSGKVKKK